MDTINLTIDGIEAKLPEVKGFWKQRWMPAFIYLTFARYETLNCLSVLAGSARSK
jgi:hypothetical protein